MENENVVGILNDLLTKNYDAEKGYKEASEKISHSILKTYFENQAKNRYEFGHQIKSMIKKYGGEPKKGTSFTADLHRAWISIREAFDNGDQAVYDECVRGEEAFSLEYDNLLINKVLPNDVKNLVISQKEAVDKALVSLRELDYFAK